jgi:hypothetical protein
MAFIGQEYARPDYYFFHAKFDASSLLRAFMATHANLDSGLRRNDGFEVTDWRMMDLCAGIRRVSVS